MTPVAYEGWSTAEIDFWSGYRDGRDVDAPEPSSNRSYCYRHSFAVGRAEISGRSIEAATSRRAAAIAEAKDAAVIGSIPPGGVAH